ncbi:hypothetical protein CK936_19535 [Streptomyces albireticuli]|uniref:Insertion element IS402-like domain-containing protein n=1 Tax=Streptomyces albireticuli TaxID=1940 RepID=A0A2A2D767_9ACTN|nr:hypothetical protein CK936_19535 [Streptomyces albireticuli]
MPTGTPFSWTIKIQVSPVSKTRGQDPCLQGILFVLRTGIQWEWLPQELGFGSGMTCWRWLREWDEAGVWGRLRL